MKKERSTPSDEVLKKKIRRNKIICAISVIFMIICVAFACSDNGKTPPKEDEATKKEVEFDSIDFAPFKARNDVTGRGRISVIAENIQMEEYALNYYKKCFENDDEVHAIVNFNYNTTTSIVKFGPMLDVIVYEYVKGEEHDAKKICSGMLLAEYHVDIETGTIEKISHDE